MTILEYLKQSGKHDKTSTQILYATILFVLLNSVTGAALLWPLCVHQAAINTHLQKMQIQSQQDAILLNQSEDLKARYDTLMKEREPGVGCEWLPGKEADNIDLTFEQARGCLESWLQHNNKAITEMTFYKKGKVRAIEVMHD